MKCNLEAFWRDLFYQTEDRSNPQFSQELGRFTSPRRARRMVKGQWLAAAIWITPRWLVTDVALGCNVGGWGGLQDLSIDANGATYYLMPCIEFRMIFLQQESFEHQILRFKLSREYWMALCLWLRHSLVVVSHDLLCKGWMSLELPFLLAIPNAQLAPRSPFGKTCNSERTGGAFKKQLWT